METKPRILIVMIERGRGKNRIVFLFSKGPEITVFPLPRVLVLRELRHLWIGLRRSQLTQNSDANLRTLPKMLAIKLVFWHPWL